MTFRNSVVGGVSLVIPAIQSPNFSSDTEGRTAGWQINQDGSATFLDVTIGSSDYTIDSDGNAVFATVTANDDVVLQGESLVDLLEAAPRGMLAIVTLSGDTGGFNGTAKKIGEIVIPNFDPTRQYSVGSCGVHFDKQALSTFSRVTIRGYIAWDTSPTTASTQLVEYQFLSDTTSNADWIVDWRHTFKDSSPGGTDAHIAWFFTTNINDVNGLRCIGPAVAGGTPGSRLYAEDLGPLVTYSDYNMGTGVVPVQTYTRTYTAQWSESYQSDGTARGSADNGHCFQGYYSGTNGNQFSMIGFDYATIASNLSGATITKVEVYLDNQHFYSNSGGTAIIGTHNQASAPSPASYPSSTDNITRSSFSYGQAKWVSVDTSIGDAFKAGTAKGILLGKGQTSGGTLQNDQQYYAYFSGAGETNKPKLRITYQK